MQQSDFFAVIAIALGTVAAVGSTVGLVEYAASTGAMGLEETTIEVLGVDGQVGVPFGVVTATPGIARQHDDFVTPRLFRVRADEFEGVFVSARSASKLQLRVRTRISGKSRLIVSGAGPSLRVLLQGEQLAVDEPETTASGALEARPHGAVFFGRVQTCEGGGLGVRAGMPEARHQPCASPLLRLR